MTVLILNPSRMKFKPNADNSVDSLMTHNSQLIAR